MVSLRLLLTTSKHNGTGDELMSQPNRVFTYGVFLGLIGFFIGILAPVAGLFLGAMVAALGLYSRRVNRTGGLVIIIGASSW